MTPRHLRLVPSTPAWPSDHPVTLCAIAATNHHTRRAYFDGTKRTVEILVREYDGPPGITIWNYPWSALGHSPVAYETLRCRLTETYAARTARQRLWCVRSTLKALVRLGNLSAEQYARTVDSPRIRVDSKPAGRLIETHEIAAMVAIAQTAPNSALAARDSAMIVALVSLGARRAELAGIDIGDVDVTNSRIELRVTKGGNPRPAFLHTVARRALIDWLQVRGTVPGPLFNPVTRTGRILVQRRLSDHQIWKVVRAHADAAGIRPITSHDFRRTMISQLLDAGVDVATVSRIAGHTDAAQTVRYDRRSEDTCRRAIERLDLRLDLSPPL